MRRTVVVAAAVALAACSTKQRIKTETAIADALVSDEQEAQLGLQVHQELEKQKVRYATDATVVQYVEGIAARLMPFAQRDRRSPVRTQPGLSHAGRSGALQPGHRLPA